MYYSYICTILILEGSLISIQANEGNMYPTSTSDSAMPFTNYDWYTNPNGTKEDIIKAATGYTKVPGPYWGGFKPSFLTVFYITWESNMTSSDVVTFEMTDGSTGELIASSIAKGKEGTVSVSTTLYPNTVNIWIRNDLQNTFEFSQIHIKTRW